MGDPYPPGHWTSQLSASDFMHLRPGGRYQVMRAFTDFDGDEHPAGESWTFLASNFVPYHDGLSQFVSMDGVQEWHIRLSWRPEDQGPIIDALADHVRPLPD